MPRVGSCLGEQHAQVNPVLLEKLEAHPGAAHTKTDADASPQILICLLHFLS